MAATLQIMCIWKLSATFNWHSEEADIQPYLSVKSKGSLPVLVHNRTKQAVAQSKTAVTENESLTQEVCY